MFNKPNFVNGIFSMLTAILLIVASLTACSGSSSGKDEKTDSTTVTDDANKVPEYSGPKKYEMKSGIVYYKPLEMMKGMKIQQVMYFDDYGNKSVTETTSDVNMMGVNVKEISVNILDGDVSINYTLEKIEKGKDVTPKVAKKTTMNEELKAKTDMMGFFSDEEKLKTEYDYKDEGTETIAGVEGKKFSVKMEKNKKQRLTVVTYKGIMLKGGMMGVNIEAEKIDENATIPADKFKVPEGYTIEEVSPENMLKGK